MEPQKTTTRGRFKRAHELILSSDVESESDAGHDEDAPGSSTKAFKIKTSTEASSENDYFDSTSQTKPPSETSSEVKVEYFEPVVVQTRIQDWIVKDDDHDTKDDSSDYVPSETSSIATEDSDSTADDFTEQTKGKRKRKQDKLTNVETGRGGTESETATTSQNEPGDMPGQLTQKTRKKRGPYTGTSTRTKQRHARLARENAAKAEAAKAEAAKAEAADQAGGVEESGAPPRLQPNSPLSELEIRPELLSSGTWSAMRRIREDFDAIAKKGKQ